MKRILVMHSGGLDSTTLLHLAKSQGHQVVSLGIDYRQTHAIEHLFAQKQADRLGIERNLISVAWKKPVREIPVGRDTNEIGKEVSKAFLPGRNVVLISLALAHGAGWGADEVWTGINAVNFSGYPDCTPAFLQSYQTMMSEAAPNAPSLKAPLLHMSKPEIAKLAKSLGINSGDTWSCYRPQTSMQGSITPCGQCDACVLHRFAWANLEPPTTNV